MEVGAESTAIEGRKRGTMPAITEYRPGDEVPASGIYNVVHDP